MHPGSLGAKAHQRDALVAALLVGLPLPHDVLRRYVVPELADVDYRTPEALEACYGDAVAACRAGDARAVSLLLRRDVPNHVRVQSAFAAAQIGHVGCLLAAGAHATDDYGRSPAHVAAGLGRAGFLLDLHRLGCNLDQGDDDDASPALYAARAGHHACLAVLSDAGCDMLRPDFYDETPLDAARERGHEACARLILAW